MTGRDSITPTTARFELYIIQEAISFLISSCTLLPWAFKLIRIIFKLAKKRGDSVGKPDGNRPLGRPSRRWVDNIKMDLRVMGGTR
jgi:hypothetical protein